MNFDFFSQQAGDPGSLVMLAMLAWAIPWKAFAMWRAAKVDHKRWFVVLLIVNTAGIVEIVYLFFFNKKKKATKHTFAMKFVRKKVLGLKNS